VTQRPMSLYGAPGDAELEILASGSTDGLGSARVDFSPPPRGHRYIVARLRVSADVTALRPTVRVYRLSPGFPNEGPDTFLAGSVTGDSDVAEGEPEVVPHPSWLRVVWDDADPGVAVRATIEVVQQPVDVV